MKVEVLLFNFLRDGRGKVVSMDVNEGTTVNDLIRLLEIEDDVVANVLVNQADAEFFSLLKEGDSVSLFPLLAGG
ncbi:MAG: MoaD/ThiS family protein [Oscillospiraceae bacterium]|nr:MoaD/ThiS family protein [Oscillospiraceae bacterium]